MLHCVNVALYYVSLFYYYTTISCCTLFVLHYLMLHYFNYSLCDTPFWYWAIWYCTIWCCTFWYCAISILHYFILYYSMLNVLLFNVALFNVVLLTAPLRVCILFHQLVSSGCTTSVTYVRCSDQRSFVAGIIRGFCQVPSSPFLNLSCVNSKDENSNRPLAGEKTKWYNVGHRKDDIYWYRI